MYNSHKSVTMVHSFTPWRRQTGPSHLVLLGLLTCALISQVSPAVTTRPPPTQGPRRDLQTTRYPPRSQTTTTARILIPKPTTLPYFLAYYYPNPQTQPIVCRYPLTHKSYFCDPNGLISEKEGKYIDRALEQIRTDTKCLCKTPCKNGNIKLSVAVVPSVGPPNQGRSQAETFQVVRTFAEELRKKYSFGTCEDDMLLVVSRDQEVAYLSRGVKLESVLNDSDVTSLMNEAKNLTNLSDTVRHVARLLGVQVQDVANSRQASSPLSTWTIVAVIALVVGFVIVIAIAVAGGSYCGRKCNGKGEMQTSGDGGFRNTQAAAATVTETREKRVKDKKKSSNRAWFARIGRRDRQDNGSKTKSGGSYHEYSEPTDEESNSNEGSYYNHAQESTNKDRSSLSSYDRGQNGYARSSRDRSSGTYDNSGATYTNSRHSGGSFGDRRSDRNSSYTGSVSQVATENIF